MRMGRGVSDAWTACGRATDLGAAGGGGGVSLATFRGAAVSFFLRGLILGVLGGSFLGSGFTDSGGGRHGFRLGGWGRHRLGGGRGNSQFRQRDMIDLFFRHRVPLSRKAVQPSEKRGVKTY